MVLIKTQTGSCIIDPEESADLLPAPAECKQELRPFPINTFHLLRRNEDADVCRNWRQTPSTNHIRGLVVAARPSGGSQRDGVEMSLSLN